MADKNTAPSSPDDAAGRKGRATPSRKEAEAARRAQMKQQKTRKQAASQTKAARDEWRVKSRAAMQAGVDSKYLPLRDRGPVRQFVRDFVDSRRCLSEFILPVVIVLFVLSFIRTTATVQIELTVFVVLIIGVVLDQVRLRRRLRAELAERFDSSQTRGALGYLVLRSTQTRRLRQPRPRVTPGDPLPARY